jgi:fermentation-respiration switch protein FrsA (DUF1100 family)
MLLPSVLLMNRAISGYDICDSRPVNEIGKIAPRPVLLIHSTDDQLVTVSNAYALKSAGPSAQTWIVSGPEHARIYNAGPAEYVRHVSEFFNAMLWR